MQAREFKLNYLAVNDHPQTCADALDEIALRALVVKSLAMAIDDIIMGSISANKLTGTAEERFNGIYSALWDEIEILLQEIDQAQDIALQRTGTDGGK